MHNEPLPECVKDHVAFKEHVAESGPVRLMVERHDVKIKQINNDLADGKKAFEKIDDFKNSILKAVIGSSIATIITVLCSVAGTCIYIGVYKNKVDQIEKIVDNFGWNEAKVYVDDSKI